MWHVSSHSGEANYCKLLHIVPVRFNDIGHDFKDRVCIEWWMFLVLTHLGCPE